MTEPTDPELLELATPYALDAVDEHERADIERRVAAAPSAVSDEFHDEVRTVQEAMSAVSIMTALEPPEHLRARVLAAVKPKRKFDWRKPLLAAASVVVIALGALGVGLALRPAPTQTTAEEVFAAPDVHTVSEQIPGGGTATVVFSRAENAGVLVMNDVPKPQAGTVYQMWLINDSGPTSAGTMDQQAVSPSTTVSLPDLRQSTTLAFTVEPGTGSTEPTTPIIAQLSLS